MRDSHLPDAVRSMGPRAREDARAIASKYNLDLNDASDAAFLVDTVRLRNERDAISDARHEELTNHAINKAGLSTAQAAEVRNALRVGSLLSEAPSGPVLPSPNLIVVLDRVEISGSASPLRGPALGTYAVDNLAIGAGDVAQYVAKNIGERPWLQVALTVLDVAAGPVAFAVREAISASVIGDKLREAQEFVQETISGRFSAMGYGDDEAFSGGVGAMSILGVTVGSARQAIGNVRSVVAKRNHHGAGGRLDPSYVKELGLPAGTSIRTRPDANVNQRLYADAWDKDAQRLRYRDPATGDWKPVSFNDPLTRDHVLSQRNVVDLAKEYGANAKQVEHLMTWDENFQLLPRSLNSSKGDSMGTNWTSYPGSDGARVPIPLQQQRALQDRQDTIRANMDRWLRDQGLTSRRG